MVNRFMCYVLTVFMILNNRKNEEEERLEIKVGQETIKESEHTKLLGVEIQETVLDTFYILDDQ